MTGPGAVMPLAPSLPSRPEAKLANAADAAGIDTAKFGAFSELFSAINSETEAPAERERDADLPAGRECGGPAAADPDISRKDTANPLCRGT